MAVGSTSCGEVEKRRLPRCQGVGDLPSPPTKPDLGPRVDATRI
jgi:hypothetical protein